MSYQYYRLCIALSGVASLALVHTSCLASEPGKDSGSSDTVVVPSFGTTPQATKAPPAKTGLSKIKVPANAKVMVIPVNDTESTRYGMIDPWQAGFVGRRTREAKREQYDLIILEINTNGGMVASCEKINNSIADSGVPSVALIRGKAFSGGAIISLGCEAITMEPGSQIGGAQAVGLFGDLGADQREKARSMLVAMTRGLSEKHGYPETLARGMVDSEVKIYETDDPKHRFMTDEDLEDWKKNADTRGPVPKTIRTVKDEGQILTLTSGEAVNSGIASSMVPNRDALLKSLGVTSPDLNVASITPTEKVARFLGHPLWLVLLVIIALVALIWEMKSPGHGIGYLIFGFSLGLMFWLAIFADTAGTLELILFLIGAILVAVEFFVLPGFGVAGFSGFALVLASIILAFIPEGALQGIWPGTGPANPFQADLVVEGAMWASVAMISVIVAIVVVLVGGIRLPGFGRLALGTDVGRSKSLVKLVEAKEPEPPKKPAPAPVPAKGGTTTKALPRVDTGKLSGTTGVTETILRPSGKVRIGGASRDAIAEGAWIEKGRKVKVVSIGPTGIVVREVV